MGKFKDKDKEKKGDEEKTDVAPVVDAVNSDSKTKKPAKKAGTILRSLWGGKLKINDAPSGKKYYFPRAGTEVMVEAEDVAHLMAKGQNAGSCCGGAKSHKSYFEVDTEV